MNKLLIAFLLCSSLIFAQEGIDKTPAWYTGVKPWTEISKNERNKILQLHAGFEAAQKEAHTAQTKQINPKLAQEGKDHIARIVAKHHLNKFYKTPSPFGYKMMLWIPEVEWKNLPPQDRRAVIAYASSLYKNWGIGVGRIKGQDVMADRDLKIN